MNIFKVEFMNFQLQEMENMGMGNNSLAHFVTPAST